MKSLVRNEEVVRTTHADDKDNSFCGNGEVRSDDGISGFVGAINSFIEGGSDFQKSSTRFRRVLPLLLHTPFLTPVPGFKR